MTVVLVLVGLFLGALVGGVLGIGDNFYPIPWKMLQYDVSLGGYIVDIDRQVLEGAPKYTTDNAVDWVSPAYGRSIDDYYSNRLL